MAFVLNIGDTIVVGSVIGKIRGMTDDKGQKVKSAGPSTPVEIIGLPEVPVAGDIFYEVENEKVACHAYSHSRIFPYKRNILKRKGRISSVYNGVLPFVHFKSS